MPSPLTDALTIGRTEGYGVPRLAPSNRHGDCDARSRSIGSVSLEGTVDDSTTPSHQTEHKEQRTGTKTAERGRR